MTKVRTSQLAPTGATTGQALVYNGTLWLPGAYDDTTKIAKALVDAKGDLIVGSAADTVVRLAVGTGGQALVADAASPAGLKWDTPNDTTKVPKSLFDATGDLLVGSADDTPAKLAAGAEGTYLRAGAAGALGWAAPQAAEVAFAPFGTIEATTVQAALEELSQEGGGGGGGGGGHIVEDEGTALPQQPNLNFVGAGVIVSDDPVNGETRVEITGAAPVGSATFTRQSVTYTTAVLAANTDEVGVIALAAGYRLYQIETSRPARVRLYDNTTHRDADRLRTRIETPEVDSGLMLDYVTQTGALTATLSPLVDGFVYTGTDAALTVENMGTAGTVTVTLVYLRTE